MTKGPARLSWPFAFVSSAKRASGVHLLEEFAIGLGGLEFVDKELDRVYRTHRVEDAA